MKKQFLALSILIGLSSCVLSQDTTLEQPLPTQSSNEELSSSSSIEIVSSIEVLSSSSLIPISSSLSYKDSVNQAYVNTLKTRDSVFWTQTDFPCKVYYEKIYSVSNPEFHNLKWIEVDKDGSIKFELADNMSYGGFLQYYSTPLSYSRKKDINTLTVTIKADAKGTHNNLEYITEMNYVFDLNVEHCIDSSKPIRGDVDEYIFTKTYRKGNVVKKQDKILLCTETDLVEKQEHNSCNWVIAGNYPWIEI